MPRTEVYQLRLTKAEKDELAERAKLQGVSIAKLIRQKLGLAATEERRILQTPGVADGLSAAVAEVEALDPPSYDRLVAKHKLRMPTSAAERLARKELQ